MGIPVQWMFRIHKHPFGVRLEFLSSEGAGGNVVYSVEQTRGFVVDLCDRAGLPAPWC